MRHEHLLLYFYGQMVAATGESLWTLSTGFGAIAGLFLGRAPTAADFFAALTACGFAGFLTGACTGLRACARATLAGAGFAFARAALTLGFGAAFGFAAIFGFAAAGLAFATFLAAGGCW